ncbi:MAG TPA: carboxymuconolactone decarboxylase family protein [Gammaproteobacteria bacterium]|nr:carboxymuconolactone decarboxylase family protein [Gammaproteobacteria bacterium]
MTLEQLKDQLPGYAKDLRLNLESVLGETGAAGLTQKQIALVALASAIASRYAPLAAAASKFAAEHASAEELDGARAAAAIMAMNNVYYRFTHSLGDAEYATLRAGLRMNVIARPGCDRTSFELACLAVSAINGCAACMDSHEKTLRSQGLGAQGVQSAARIAAVVHAVAVTLEQASPMG